MYLLKEKKKYIALLLVLILIFQFVSILFSDIDITYNYKQKPVSMLTSQNVHMDCIFYNKLNRKNSFNSLSAINTIIPNHLALAEISPRNSLYTINLADNRREIKQSIPHYFHGGKFKDSIL